MMTTTKTSTNLMSKFRTTCKEKEEKTNSKTISLTSLLLTWKTAPTGKQNKSIMPSKIAWPSSPKTM